MKWKNKKVQYMSDILKCLSPDSKDITIELTKSASCGKSIENIEVTTCIQ